MLISVRKRMFAIPFHLFKFTEKHKHQTLAQNRWMLKGPGLKSSGLFIAVFQDRPKVVRSWVFFNPTVRQNSTKATSRDSRPMQLKNSEDR